MKIPYANTFRIIKFIFGFGFTLALVLFVLLSYRQITGQSLGLRSFFNNLSRPLINPIKSISNHQNIVSKNQGDFTNIIFLHHSTGRNLIEQGSVRTRFSVAGFSFWDHDYNHIGLRDPEGNYTGYDYRIPDDNTDSDGYATIFDQTVYQLPINALSGLLQHEVVVIKSCFPNSQIQNADQLEQKKDDYRLIRATMKEYPEKLFIIVTQPPLNPSATNLDNAIRARELANWLKSEDYHKGYSNIYTFDFFDLLAESDPNSLEENMLRVDYRDGTDSHPNKLANETISPLFTEFIISSIEEFRLGLEK